MTALLRHHPPSWGPADGADRGDGARLGMWSAVATVTLAVVTAVVGVTTPPRSGPMCQVERCVTAPYTDVAGFVPRDYLWLYPAVGLQVAFLLLVAVLVGSAAARRRGQAVAAMGFTVLGSGLLLADYGLQLFVVQPSLLAGEAEGLGLLSQYNPHGVFIGLENLGYAALAVGFACLSSVLAGSGGRLRAVSRVFLAGAVATWVALAWLTVAYQERVDYRFELAAISIYWLVATVTGTLLALEFRARGGT